MPFPGHLQQCAVRVESGRAAAKRDRKLVDFARELPNHCQLYKELGHLAEIPVQSQM